MAEIAWVLLGCALRVLATGVACLWHVSIWADTSAGSSVHAHRRNGLAGWMKYCVATANLGGLGRLLV